MVEPNGSEERMTEDDDVPAPVPSARARAGARSQRRAAAHDVAGDEPIEREGSEDQEITDDDRFAMFQDSATNSILPDPPYQAGFHLCWLSTTNGRDTIATRQRLGYQLVRAAEVPGWEGVGGGTGQFDGVVQVNEMVLARIPLRLYNRYMRDAHHTRPLAEEEKIRAALDSMKGQAEQVGGRLIEGDGTANLVQRARAPADLRE